MIGNLQLINARTHEDAKLYLEERYKQLASIGITVEDEILEDKGIVTVYSNTYCSIYILEQYRGQQQYIKLLQKYMLPVMTMDDCNIVPYLEKIRCNHIVVSPSRAYQMISSHYGDNTAKRSGVRLMNHIDEGLQILNQMGVIQETLDAYCLHPIVQSDADLAKVLMDNEQFLGISAKSLLLAMEYRRVANSYLSTMDRSNFTGIPFIEVKHMLIADKIQNERDFAKYHEGTHERSAELREYFDNWFDILEIEKIEKILGKTTITFEP